MKSENLMEIWNEAIKTAIDKITSRSTEMVSERWSHDILSVKLLFPLLFLYFTCSAIKSYKRYKTWLSLLGLSATQTLCERRADIQL